MNEPSEILNIHTERVIFWLDQHAYSKQHWATVATECMEQEDGNLEQAIVRLSEGLKDFHKTFRDAVVKPDNVLHDFISMGLEHVNWITVAKTRFLNLSIE
jgi:hypothetical protein